MDKYFDFFLSQWGQPEIATPVSERTLHRFRGKLPDTLLGYWSHYGFAGYHHGLLWMVNPDDYEHALESWIGDTPIMEQDAYYVIARSAFGKLYLWGERTGYLYDIDPQTGVIYKNNDDDEGRLIRKGLSEKAMMFFWSVIKPDSSDENDDDIQPLFDRALKRLGPCTADEMYAFTPAPFLGGARRVENLEKVNVHIQLDLLAQFGHRELLDFEGMKRKAFGG